MKRIGMLFFFYSMGLNRWFPGKNTGVGSYSLPPGDLPKSGLKPALQADSLPSETTFVVQLPSHAQLFATPRTAACQASLSFAISQSLPKFMSITPVMPSRHLILCRPLLLPPSILPSMRIFANESAVHIKWPKYRLSISPSSEYSRLISLLSRGFSRVSSNTSSNASIFQCSAFFIDCPALTAVHDYWKECSLDYTELCQQSDVFAFNMLSSFVIAFLPRSNHLLISWLQSPSAVILDCKKRKSVTASTFYLPWKWWDQMQWS